MRRPTLTLAIVLALSAALGAAPNAAASSEPPVYARGGSFEFYGSGFGHGLGMSQYGAYGLAKDGWAHKAILTHFYSKTRVTQSKPKITPSILRIGLTQARVKIHLAAQAGAVTLRVENRKTGPLVGTIPKGKTWTVRAEGSQYRVLNGSGTQVGGQDWGGPNRNLYATYTGDGARVHSPEAGATYNRGWLEFNLYDCAGGCVERLILSVDPQGYLDGLSEVPSSWPMQALQAQAVAGRSYAFAKARYGQHRDPCNCALYDTSADQVYTGWAKEGGLDGKRWVKAVKQTAGQVVTFSGTLVQAFYTSSDGGYTEDNENVWGGTPLAWLRGVCDPGDFTSANPNRIWHDTFTAGGVTNRLKPYTGNIGTVQSFSDFSRGVSGRIITVKVNGGGGASMVSGTELRAALGMPDDRVWINRNKNVTGSIRTKYDHIMCAPGLPTTPQVSVSGGSRQTFAVGAIYHDVGGATVWLKGPVYDEYTAAGGANGVLGLPLGGPKNLSAPAGCGAATTCSRTEFKHGRIYYKGGVGAHALWGRVLVEYLNEGGAGGSLGFPTSRVSVSGGTASASFEHGSITCDSGSPCTVS